MRYGADLMVMAKARLGFAVSLIKVETWGDGNRLIAGSLQS